MANVNNISMDPKVLQNTSPQSANLPQQQIQEQQNVPKRSHFILVLIILFLFIIAAMVGIIFYKQSRIHVSQNMAAIPTATAQKYNSSISQVTTIPTVAPTWGVFTPSYPPNTWEKYSNASFHYSLKYPPDWKNNIIQNGATLLLTSSDYGSYTGAEIIISVVPTKNTSADQEFQQGEKTEPVAIPYKDIVINGINSLQYDIGPAQKALPVRSTVLVIGGYAYHFSTARDQKTEINVQSIYNQILSSFTFIK
jgi:hypothetical protein